MICIYDLKLLVTIKFCIPCWICGVAGISYMLLNPTCMELLKCWLVYGYILSIHTILCFPVSVYYLFTCRAINKQSYSSSVRLVIDPLKSSFKISSHDKQTKVQTNQVRATFKAHLVFKLNLNIFLFFGSFISPI